jgi:hypothetical protein
MAGNGHTHGLLPVREPPIKSHVLSSHLDQSLLTAAHLCCDAMVCHRIPSLLSQYQGFHALAMEQECRAAELALRRLVAAVKLQETATLDIQRP